MQMSIIFTVMVILVVMIDQKILSALGQICNCELYVLATSLA